MENKTRLKTQEIFAIVLIIVGMKMADSTATQYTQVGKNAFWLMPIVSAIVILPSFVLLMWLLKKYKNKNLIELIDHICGKFFGKIIGFILFIISYSLLIFDSRNYAEEVKMLYFPESPVTSILIILLVVAFYGAKRGFETISVATFLILPYVKGGAFILAGLIIFQQAIWQRIFPIFGDGLDSLLLEGVKSGGHFTELFLLTIAFTSFSGKSSFPKGIYFGAVLSLIEIVFFFLLFAVTFDYNSIEKVSFPFHEITQLVSFGNYFTNIETFFFVFWIVAAIMRICLLLYLVSWLLGAVIEVKEYEPILFPLAFFILIFGMMPSNLHTNELVIRNSLITIATPIIIFIPILLFIIALIKGELKKS